MFKQLLAALIVFTGLALGQTAGTPDITPAQQAPINAAQLPFFFPVGFYKTTDPLRQREEYVRWLNSTWYCNQGNKDGMDETIPGSDSISVQTNVVSTDSVTENPGAHEDVLRSLCSHAGRSYPLLRHVPHRDTSPTQSSLWCAKVFKKQAVDGAQRDYDFYVIIYDKSIAARAAKLGIPRKKS
jgi:hypothetical protein